MLLNCDLGEISLEHDKKIMPYIDQANIACGQHAGDESTMDETVALAAKHKVQIGAHPSYPDRENFGRLSMDITSEKLSQLFITQVNSLISFCDKHAVTCHYVKPHGALYNDMMKNLPLFTFICQLMSENFPELSLMIQATPDESMYREVAKRYSVHLILEAFADRKYLSSGLLAPRKQQGAVLENKNTILTQVKNLHQNNQILTADNTAISLNAETLCVHGDSQHALDWVREIRRYLNEYT